MIPFLPAQVAALADDDWRKARNPLFQEPVFSRALRLVDVLGEIGRPLDASAPRAELPGLWFSPAEAYALLTMQHLLENLQPGLLAPHVKPLLARFNAILGSGDHSHEEVARRVRVLHQAAREMKNDHYAVVNRAFTAAERLRP